MRTQKMNQRRARFEMILGPLDTSTTIIIFECNDIRRDTGLILLKRKSDEKFELHLHDDYTNQAIAMVLDIKDFAKMFESLEEYFLKAQIDDSNE
jgi:hypothetical protein